jgi:predicted NBD/HSP70 family sugar kinase
LQFLTSQQTGTAFASKQLAIAPVNPVVTACGNRGCAERLLLVTQAKKLAGQMRIGQSINIQQETSLWSAGRTDQKFN